MVSIIEDGGRGVGDLGGAGGGGDEDGSAPDPLTEVGLYDMIQRCNERKALFVYYTVFLVLYYNAVVL